MSRCRIRPIGPIWVKSMYVTPIVVLRGVPEVFKHEYSRHFATSIILIITITTDQNSPGHGTELFIYSIAYSDLC